MCVQVVLKSEKKKKQDEVTSQQVECMAKFVKKSKIEKVSEVKNFQNSSLISLIKLLN